MGKNLQFHDANNFGKGKKHTKAISGFIINFPLLLFQSLQIIERLHNISA